MLESHSKKRPSLHPSEVVKAARDTQRLTTSELANYICDDFYELHGDRAYGDDAAIYGGVGRLDGRPVTIIGTEKGHTTKENVERNFGSPHAEGYRKAIRLVEQADKFKRPVISFINTSGAFCDMESEDRGVGEAIARSMQAFGRLSAPNISVLIGEGGSGGALALAVTNRVWILEDAMYSILSPEGFATILWKDVNRANEAAELMKFTAKDLYELGVVDEIIPVRQRGEAITKEHLADNIKTMLIKELEDWDGKSAEAIRLAREARFRQF
ncbi:carboxyltransferase subunit alpha [Aerococcus sp. UMB7834]|uniref:carboxyltransferase subunit alpha n=1 Tax=Aerococcus sp. UMB7834 TaxID=3046342 RepID=UPI00254FB2A2|nr:carboxyltransferase subunit alpha [Aerococcus sp. UMB7834]MDK6804225.1 carboxyltransferase subunit alpha [Aerococcus sp. UMB7834]